MSTPLERSIDAACRPVPPPTNPQPGVKYPVAAGELSLGAFTLRCYVLNTGERIFNAEDLEKLIGGGK